MRDEQQVTRLRRYDQPDAYCRVFASFRAPAFAMAAADTPAALAPR